MRASRIVRASGALRSGARTLVFCAIRRPQANGTDLREGDMIVEFSGQAIAGIDDLHKLQTGVQVGVPSQLTGIRYRKKLQVVVTPEDSASQSN